ncbi:MULTISPECIES: hypothetical protein [unclassified Streptomyces]|uniref:hypothetical protein n=1 Tax=unclassified Streptomyces TaxID=2593676 RepID=UPI003418E57C
MTTEPEPWTIGHELTLFQQVRTLDSPAGIGTARWRETGATGQMLAVCNCGLDTGWISHDELPSREVLADGEQHAALIAEGWGRALRDPANRGAVSMALRTEARINPQWIRDIIRREERINGGKPYQV